MASVRKIRVRVFKRYGFRKENITFREIASIKKIIFLAFEPKLSLGEFSILGL